MRFTTVHPRDRVHSTPGTPLVLLDSGYGASLSGDLLRFAHPVREVDARTADDVPGVIAQAEREARAGRHVVGFVCYEAAPAFDGAMVTHAPGALPLAWFGAFEDPAPSGGAADAAAIDPGAGAACAWSCDDDRTRYEHKVGVVRQAIARGDVYQVNLTTRLRGTIDDPTALFYRLRAGQGGRYAAYIRLPPASHAIVSASPELFFQRVGERILTRPMKGTARRGRWSAEDDAAARALRESPKERAENLMIVDLLRNDLGRIARFGTVRVPRLLEVERYPTVLQLTSTVAAELRSGVTLPEIFAALFPCGSVTGAPKIAAMRAIAALEQSSRGVYCGAIGYLAPGGDATFSVAIRTATVDLSSGAVVYGAGGGVTWDSTATGEYDEMRAKSAILEHAPDGTTADGVSLIETMRLEGGRFARLERHLARVSASAAYFGIPLQRDDVRAALHAHAASSVGAAQRVRLVVTPDGRPHVEARPLDALPDPPLPVAIARELVRRDDRFLYHKTTRREGYERRRRARPDVFDVILTNEAGELTELTIGNLVVELDGQRVTPPLACGLLAGTMRGELLDRGAIVERVLTPRDLARCSALWMVNSVREWVPLRLVE
ncbi:MAG TPA: aminodeoxychorismate synthase component I [Gemmatimonadaceae bacterium]|nr:aminodeoxychorismate synthase component I [Gemmatimonadaceae bacterium]